MEVSPADIAAVPTPKDEPLLLRRRARVATAEVDGEEVATKVPGDLELSSDHWPRRHEFAHDWLLRTPEATVEHDVITLALANAHATYRIVDSVEIDGETRTSTGFWGELIEGTVD